MKETLEMSGWDSEYYLLLPQMLIFDDDLNREDGVGEILSNRENHFIIYGTDWNSSLLGGLMRSANRHFDFSIAELSEYYLEDLSYVASMKNLYVLGGILIQEKGI